MLSLFLLVLAMGLFLGVSDSGNRLWMLIAAAVCVPLLFRLWPRVMGQAARLGTVRVWLILTGLCLAVKLGWVLAVRVPIEGDYFTYWEYAIKLAKEPTIRWGGRYITLFPHIFGYSHFLGLFIKILGPQELLAPVLNVLLTACGGSFLFLLCRRLKGLQAAISAYLLWILCPSQTMYNGLVCSEPLYTALLLGFLLLVAEWDARGKAGWKGPAVGVLGGLVLWWMNTVRPIGAIPIIALVIWLVCLKQDGGRWRERSGKWLPLLGILLAVYLAMGPVWNAYFTSRLGKAPASGKGYSILVGLNPRSGGTWNQEDADLLDYYKDQPGLTAQEVQEKMGEAARERLTSGEVNFPALLKAKLKVFLGSDDMCVVYSGAALSHDRWYRGASSGFYYLTVLLALWGAAVMWRRKERSTATLAPLFVIGLTLAHMLVEVAGRYHYAILPALILIGQYALFPGREPELQKGED